MADHHNVSLLCVEALLNAGMTHATCSLSVTRKTELTVDGGKISLLRTTDDTGLSLSGIREEKKGSSSMNRTDAESIRNCVAEVVELVEAGEADPANVIAEKQPEESFSRGSEEPDLDLMYARMKTFLKYTREKYPSLILEQAVLDHTAQHRYYNNSNGVSFHSVQGGYNLMVMFTSKVGKNASSFNYAVVASKDLSSQLPSYGGVDRLMGQSTEQTVTETLRGSFTGDVIITPECMEGFTSMLTGYLRDYPMITGTSMFKDSLGEVIADKRLSVHSSPVSDELASGYFFTMDGFKSGNNTIIENGVLKSFLLSLYGSKRTGMKKAVNSGGFYVIDRGNSSLDDMVKTIDRGILLCRFSGGNPASSGDFSGVAKNSYYIENGEIKYPIAETMVAGNLKDMIKNIKSISKERVNNGDSIIPWIAFSGISVSGK